jgi:hypothetical protein
LLLQKDVELKERDFFKEQFRAAELQELAAPVGLSELFCPPQP